MSREASRIIKENKETKEPKIDLANIGLTRLPNQLFECVWLEEIILSENKFFKQNSFSNFFKFTFWFKRNNNLELLEKLPLLKKLDLSKNQFSNIHFIENLKHIAFLDLSKNKIIDISSLSQLKNLETLILENNQIFNINPLATLTQLQDLKLGFNRIVSIKSIQNLTQLQVLELSNNKIEDITHLESLTQLRKLNLGQNQITNISTIQKLQNLEDLNVSVNQIDNAQILSDISGLKILDIHKNQISDIEFFKKLSRLKKVDLSSNEINNIDPLIDYVKKYNKYLNKENDKIKIVNDWLKGEREINIKDNPLGLIPETVLQYSPKIFENYLNEIKQQGSEYLYEAKMIIVGDARAGKTSLRYKLYSPMASLPGEDKSTRGIDIQSLEYDDFHDKNERIQKFIYNVWDFGGQHIYWATHQFFLTNRSLYVLVLDSEKTTPDFNINYWLQAVEIYGSGSPLLIVKNEKYGRKIKINIQERMGRFRFIKGDYDIDLNAIRHTDEANYSKDKHYEFKRLIRDIKVELKRLPLVGLQFPTNWVKIRLQLQELSKKYPYIYRSQYIDLCNRLGVKDFENQMDLSRIFHDLGVFLHFQDYPALEEFIILQNTWATDAVFAVLDTVEVMKSNGKFTESQLSTIWQSKNYDSSTHKKLLALMMQFEICYQIFKNKDSLYIVPEMLDQSVPPNYVWENKNDMRLQYQYEFMPKGLLARLIVRLHKSISLENDRQIVWKNGVKIDGATLDCPNTFAEIKEAWDNKRLLLRFQGIFVKELMSKITYQIDQLNSDLLKQNPNNPNSDSRSDLWHKMIPCCCNACINQEDKYFYNYTTLLNAKEKGKDIQCQVSFDYVKIDELLDGVFPQKKSTQKNNDSISTVFISYAHADEYWKNELVKNIKPLIKNNIISEWNDNKIESGFWDEQIHTAIEKADVFILLITHNFISSEYIFNKEIKIAYEKFKKGETKIFPIICDSCIWEEMPISHSKEFNPDLKKEGFPLLGQFQAFPKNGKPIKNWENQQDGFVNVIEQLKKCL